MNQHAELIAAVRMYAGEGAQTDAARQAQREIAKALSRLTAGDVSLPEERGYCDVDGDWQSRGHSTETLKDYGNRRAAAAALAERDLSKITPGERVNRFRSFCAGYCQECGYEDPRGDCQCRNDD